MNIATQLLLNSRRSFDTNVLYVFAFMFTLGAGIVFGQIGAGGTDIHKEYNLAGREIRLGEAEPTLMAALKLDKTLLVAMIGDHSYHLSRRLQEGSPVLDLGDLEFSAGKLVQATKRWFIGDIGSANIAAALHNALADINIGILTPLAMHQEERNSPEMHLRETIFYCGDRQVQMKIFSVAGITGETVQIDEVLKNI